MISQTIQSCLNALVPIDTISSIINQIQIVFLYIAGALLFIGLALLTVRTDSMRATARIIILYAVIAAAPWFITLLQDISSGVVHCITSVDSNMNWIVVPNSNSDSWSLNYTQPYKQLAQYMAGRSLNPTGSILDVFNPAKWGNYLVNGVLMTIAGISATITIFIMQVTLILQKLILLGSKILLPVFISMLPLGASEGAAQNFIKHVIGVIFWPVGWALVHIGTMAMLTQLHPPNWEGIPPFQLTLSIIPLLVVCLWMIVGTVVAPIFIARSLTNGSNFSHDLLSKNADTLGGMAKKASQQLGGTLLGALGSIAGPKGAAVGYLAGGAMGEKVGSTLQSGANQMVGSNGQHATPSSTSTSAADKAVAALSKVK
jgi:hypothetical protein